MFGLGISLESETLAGAYKERIGLNCTREIPKSKWHAAKTHKEKR